MSKYIFPSNSKPYISNCYPPSTAEPGAVRYDSGTQSLQVFDGSVWQSLGETQFTLTWEAEEAIDKMIDLSSGPALAELSDKYPLVAEALGQLEVALKLCQNNEPDDPEKE
jgi:hypothetical protein